MIPILYDTNETAFISNGLGRLRDVISCVVTEERNGIYECDFQYPVDGANYEQIQIGRVIGVTHDETEDIQPFDIVSFTRPIDGVVTFHCTHISYRQSYMTVTGANINSLSSAFALLATASPSNPFSYQTDISSSAYMAAADGIPKTVRALLGGVEGSILDAYGGEYEWDKWKVILHSARGAKRGFSIRYGVNMLDYNEELDSQGTYSSCIPYWTDGTTTIVGDMQVGSGSTITGRGECVPLDVSEKLEPTPTKAQVEAMGLSIMNANNPMLPAQTIHVEFVRLQDMGYEQFANLLDCKLCDTINVIFPFYGTTGQFKIVKTVWDVLADRFESMELGDLSVTLSEALGIKSGAGSASGGAAGVTDVRVGGVSVVSSGVANIPSLSVDTVSSESVSISSGGYQTVSISATKTGFTPIGIIGYEITGSNSQNIEAYRMYLNGTNAEARLKNVGPNTYTPSVTFYVLYKSN